MLCRWRLPAPHSELPASSRDTSGHDPARAGPRHAPAGPPTPAVLVLTERPARLGLPNLMAESGSSFVEDSTPSTSTTGVGGAGDRSSGHHVSPVGVVTVTDGRAAAGRRRRDGDEDGNAIDASGVSLDREVTDRKYISV